MPQASEMYYSEEGVYLNKAGEVVYGRTDPTRVTEIVAPGGYVPMDIARRYNLVTVTQPEVVEEVVLEEKAVTTAPENKARTNKGKK